MKYRADINGLRAIAVLAVVLFHLDVPAFGGGFVGVDIFFVISGFLITKILINERSSGGYSFVTFYERRARRILPAYFFVTLFTTISAFLVMMPYDFVDYGKSLLGSTLFFSNIVFWTEADYFAGVSEVKPLLHTWSLSVEEQFYIVFPVAFFVLLKFFPNRKSAIILVFALASFFLAQFFIEKYPDATFFLLPTRAWEVLIGSYLATMAATSVRYRSLYLHLGLLLLMYSIFWFDHATVFPAFNALYPCIGAALIIYAGIDYKDDSYLTKVLSSRVLVFIGLISYSLYLWHWPLIAFYKYEYGDLTLLSKISIGGFSLLLATITWRFIEEPFRDRKWIARKFIFIVSAVFMSLWAAAGIVIVSNNGFEDRFTKNEIEYSPLSERRERARAAYRYGQCFFGREHSDFSFSRDICLGFSEEKNNILLMGDSHAAHLWPGLQLFSDKYHFLQLNFGGCRALYGENTAGVSGCDEVNNTLFNEVVRDERLDAIIIAGRWVKEDADDLVNTIKQLKQAGKQLVLVGPIMEYSRTLPEILLYSKNFEHAARLFVRENIFETDKIVASLAKDTGVAYFSFHENFCDEKDCVVLNNNIPIQWDYGHLTEEGSKLAGQMIITKISLTDSGLNEAGGSDAK